MALKFNPLTGKLDTVADPGGSDTYVQVNDGGVFAGFIELLWNKITKVLRIQGDITLDDGGSFTTTIQCITPTANRTISYPDATGTLALVGGSSGQPIYNNGGALAGISTMTFDGTTVTLAGRLINSYNSAASAPAKTFTGTWATGGTATTNKPHVLIEPAGTTSTGWSISGTGLGINAASGFAGNLLDLQVNGARLFNVDSYGQVFAPSYCYSPGYPAGVIVGNWSGDGIHIGASAFIGFTANTPQSTKDLYLFRDTSNTFAQRNATNAQTHRIYNTYTSATDYELGKSAWERATADASTNGFISGTTLTVDSGTGIAAGQIVTGTGVTSGTRIVSGSGTTWTVSQSQTVGATGSRVAMLFGAPVFRVGTEKGSGGGTARALEFQTDGTTRVQISRDGVYRYTQPAPAAVNTSATLTIANIQAGIVTTTTAAAVDMTLPLGTDVEAGFAVQSNDLSVMWSVINTGSNAATLIANTGHTIVGAAAVAAGTSGRFTTRRTAANTYVTYRLS